jgi:hypothetical protein
MTNTNEMAFPFLSGTVWPQGVALHEEDNFARENSEKRGAGLWTSTYKPLLCMRFRVSVRIRGSVLMRLRKLAALGVSWRDSDEAI